jgi:hypothetical protein
LIEEREDFTADGAENTEERKEVIRRNKREN